ncbi:hypothetical protein MMC06_006541, partial [Schaereria dolodes]|nr:hypothetical protein [Schaereria dolodes]
MGDDRRCNFLSLCLAIIDSSKSLTPSPTSAAPQSSIARPETQSPARPASRRSGITKQIYQFALGYPQTPPEASPDINSFDADLGSGPADLKFKMGSFLFKWDHPAREVYVTGTFDDWGKTVKLNKKEGNLHEKLVDLPSVDEKIYYKFVVDGEWITDHTAPQENDPANNLNNVLLPENITKSQSPSHNPFSAMMSGVGPQSTTTGLAGKVPKESARDSSSPGSSHLPGSFPETPATEPSEFSVNPIPASSGAGNPIQLKPGEKVPDPSTFNSNTVSSTARDDSSLINDEKKDGQQEQSFGVAPIPASSGIGNPVQLKPGENVPDPSTFNRNTVNSTVRTDKESYESSSGAPQLPNVVTPQKEREAQGGMFSLPASMRNMIPESSLPMGMGASSELDSGPTIQSVGPQSTTANLAADVPKESRGVPQIVEKSQGEAGFEPEAANNASAVKGKSETEKELESKIPEEPASAEGTSTEDGGVTDKKELTGGEIAGMAAGGAGAGSAVAAAAGYMSQGKSPEDNASLPSRGIPQSVQQSINEMNK